MSDILQQLARVLEARKGADPDSSYVASLHAKGLNKILEKVGEEARKPSRWQRCRKSGNTDDVIYETADLWFHTLVMLSRFDWADDIEELGRRFDLSGSRKSLPAHSNRTAGHSLRGTVTPTLAYNNKASNQRVLRHGY